VILDHGLYSRADLAVPLMVKPALGTAYEPGRATGALVSTLDVAPTLLELSGVARPAGMLGVSQVPNLAGEAELREFAFASCGLQEGGAAIALEGALELTFPSKPLGAKGADLERSWYGTETDLGEERVRLYDSATGGPLGLSDARHGELHDRLRAAALNWFVCTQDARRALFGSSWRGDALPLERIDELVELGYLSRRP
jgi:hypothetical protein